MRLVLHKVFHMEPRQGSACARGCLSAAALAGCSRLARLPNDSRAAAGSTCRSRWWTRLTPSTWPASGRSSRRRRSERAGAGTVCARWARSGVQPLALLAGAAEGAPLSKSRLGGRGVGNVLIPVGSAHAALKRAAKLCLLGACAGAACALALGTAHACSLPPGLSLPVGSTLSSLLKRTPKRLACGMLGAGTLRASWTWLPRV